MSRHVVRYKPRTREHMERLVDELADAIASGEAVPNLRELDALVEVLEEAGATAAANRVRGWANVRMPKPGGGLQ